MLNIFFNRLRSSKRFVFLLIFAVFVSSFVRKIISIIISREFDDDDDGDEETEAEEEDDEEGVRGDDER